MRDRAQAMVPGPDVSRAPSSLDAQMAAEEARILGGLLYLASDNIEGRDVVDDYTVSSGALMLIRKLDIMAAFITGKRDEENAAEAAQRANHQAARRKVGAKP